jgi:uncharacterized protein
LLNPVAYPHGAARVRLIETHISYVFLAGRYVYKIKKPVNFGFLDYSTLERRQHFCHEEVRLNQRLCPETYLGVVPIVKTTSSLRVGEEGEALEYAVAMRRLPARRMLDRLVRSGQATEQVIERVARRAAEFHAGAMRGRGIDRFGAPEAIRFNWHENFDQIQPYVGRTISRRELRDIEDYAARFLSAKVKLLEERVAHGRIRDCHGDMRAESICVTDGLCIHDCIEFNARFRCGDDVRSPRHRQDERCAIACQPLGRRCVLFGLCA